MERNPNSGIQNASERLCPGCCFIHHAQDDADLDNPANPLVGVRQTFWDLRAAANFALGGIGSGMVIIAWLVYALNTMPAELVPRVFTFGALTMALGLLAVFFEIGRKKRFLLTLLRPQTSWMTREVYAVAAFFDVVQTLAEATIDDRADEGGSRSPSEGAHALGDAFFPSYTPTLAPTRDDYSMQKVYICLLFNMVRPRPCARARCYHITEVASH